MGIPIEFNPDLALRSIKEFNDHKREKEECIPENLEVGKTYDFLKKDQRNYWLHGPIPLVETKGDEKITPPKASVRILEATHFLNGDCVFTKGKYELVQLFDDEEGKKLPYNFFQRNGFDQ
ncbi:MAG: hypothetical protein WCG48_04055 [Candidatus Berkelbacteria bacterium]